MPDALAPYTATTDVATILAERGKNYGSFVGQALIAERVSKAMECPGWDRLAVDQKHALRVIADKIARMLNGNPDYIDNWADIAGYATLVVRRLEGAK